jgi:AcrR family transcriptional regulator
MRALPGSSSRSSQASAAVTRANLSLDQRQRILRAVAELVSKRGYNDVTVELIVKRARVSFKTFYSQFSNKEECFLALFDGAVDVANRSMTEAAAEAGDSWPCQVDAALRTLFSLVASDPATARACLVESLTAGPVFIARYEQALRTLVPLLEPGRNLSRHGADLPSTLEDTVAGAVSWFLYQRLVVNEIEELEMRRPEALEFVLRPYLGAQEARAQVEALAAGEAGTQTDGNGARLDSRA